MTSAHGSIPVTSRLVFSNRAISILGMACHLNSALFFYLHHHCQSQAIIFIRLLYLSYRPSSFPLKIKVSSLQELIPCLIRSSVFPRSSLTTHALTAPYPLEIGPELTMHDHPLDNPSDLSLVNKLVLCAWHSSGALE